jgi:hypothetical protein
MPLSARVLISKSLDLDLRLGAHAELRPRRRRRSLSLRISSLSGQNSSPNKPHQSGRALCLVDDLLQLAQSCVAEKP